MTDEQRETLTEFRRVVNMTRSELAAWLESDDSRSVGMLPGGGTKSEPGGGEAVGHHMGQRIVEITGTKQDDLTDADFEAMRKVIGYVHRHSAQRPQGDVTDTRWRHSLMNWGHDPLK